MNDSHAEVLARIQSYFAEVKSWADVNTIVKQIPQQEIDRSPSRLMRFLLFTCQHPTFTEAKDYLLSCEKEILLGRAASKRGDLPFIDVLLGFLESDPRFQAKPSVDVMIKALNQVQTFEGDRLWSYADGILEVLERPWVFNDEASWMHRLVYMLYVFFVSATCWEDAHAAAHVFTVAERDIHLSSLLSVVHRMASQVTYDRARGVLHTLRDEPFYTFLDQVMIRERRLLSWAHHRFDQVVDHDEWDEVVSLMKKPEFNLLWVSTASWRTLLRLCPPDIMQRLIKEVFRPRDWQRLVLVRIQEMEDDPRDSKEIDMATQSPIHTPFKANIEALLDYASHRRLTSLRRQDRIAQRLMQESEVHGLPGRFRARPLTPPRAQLRGLPRTVSSPRPLDED